MREMWLTTSLAACSWTSFADLAARTWAHSQKKPAITSSGWAVAIAQASSAPSGGQLAVLGVHDTTYAVIGYDPKGNSRELGSAIHLGADATNPILDLPPQPVFVDDGAGHIALVAAGGKGIAVLTGPSDAPTQTSFPAPSPVSAATLAGTTLVIGAGSELFELDATGRLASCTATDPAGAPISGVAAIATDSTHVYVWAADGGLYAYPVALGTTCAPGQRVLTSDGFAPGTGARIFLVPGTSTALLAGNGRVYVVDLVAGALPVPVLTTEPFASAAFGADFLALGFPDREVGGVTCGQVELHAFHTGALDATPDEALSDAEPQTNQHFGRSVAVMKFNGADVLAVAASDEVFAYYKTSLYDALPR
jgi:hypothetical protein